MAFKILIDQSLKVIDQNNNLHYFINNARTPLGLLKNLVPFLSFAYKLCQDYFQISADDEVVHKTC